jgi:hypothetical protein
MTVDRDDLRVLGAVRVVDATVRSLITTPLRVTGDGVRIIHNRSGLYVIAEVAGTAAYTARFALPVPPAAPQPPPVGSVMVSLAIIDPTGRYVPRRATIALPRDPDPANADAPTSLFTPVDIELYPAPTAGIGAGWATVRLSVKRQGTEEGLPFAFARIRRASDGVVIARGVADARGEMLVAVPGIPVTSWSPTAGAAVTTSTVAAKLAACFDRAALDPVAIPYPDPQQLENNFAILPHSADLELDLASGHEVARRIDVVLP